MGLYPKYFSVFQCSSVKLKSLRLFGPTCSTSRTGLMSGVYTVGAKVRESGRIRVTCVSRTFHSSGMEYCPPNEIGYRKKAETHLLLDRKNISFLGDTKKQTYNFLPVRFQVTKSKRAAKNERTSQSIAKAKDEPGGEIEFSHLVKQSAKDAIFTGLILIGIGLTGTMLYAIGKELFSGESPSGLYGRAFKICKNNDELMIALGEPIKGYGEMNRRGRRRHVSHQEYEADGVHHMRMKFYVEGPSNKGIVYLDAKKNEKRKYEFRYILVELEKYPRRTIIIEDNR